MTVIRETHTMMNGVQVGRLTDDEPLGDLARAMLAYADANRENVNPRQRNGKFNQQRPAAESEFRVNALKQENASLKNKINQLKENLENLKASVESLKTDATTKASGS